MTASSFVKIDIDGNILSDTPYRINRAGFVIHSAIHRARHDAVCVFHTHSRASVAVSCLEEGLTALSQAGLQFHERVSYHDYEGFNILLDEQQRLVESLGDNTTLMLRNHGPITVGATIGKAFQRMYYLEQACTLLLDVLDTDRPVNRVVAPVAEKTSARWHGRQLRRVRQRRHRMGGRLPPDGSAAAGIPLLTGRSTSRASAG